MSNMDYIMTWNIWLAIMVPFHFIAQKLSVVIKSRDYKMNMFLSVGLFFTAVPVISFQAIGLIKFSYMMWHWSWAELWVTIGIEVVK